MPRNPLYSARRRAAVLVSLLLPCAAAVASAVGDATRVADTTPPIRVLYFSKSSGWEHDVVKRVGGRPSFTERLLDRIAPAHGLVFTHSKDGGVFSPAYFAAFDVVLFYTSGDLTHPGTDGTPPVTAAGKQALLDAIAGGKGFVAVHSTSDSYHLGEPGAGLPRDTRPRWIVHGENNDPFLRMVGGEFLRHGPEQVARVRVVDPRFPGCGALGDHFACKEEWYSLKEFAPDAHVLLVLETAGMEGRDYRRADFPIAWARPHGKGRVWYNAMGHREDVWESARFQELLVGGIRWAAGRADADLSPNLKLVAPGAAELPPVE